MIKILLSVPLIFGLFLFGDLTFFNANNVIKAQQEVPPYAKWGQIALKKTKEKYPQADIVDYLHIGKEKGTEHSTEKFKLWLKEDSKEFGVLVDITFHNETEQIMDINYTESMR
jgi:hypothetical protein